MFGLPDVRSRELLRHLRYVSDKAYFCVNERDRFQRRRQVTLAANLQVSDGLEIREPQSGVKRLLSVITGVSSFFTRFCFLGISHAGNKSWSP